MLTIHSVRKLTLQVLRNSTRSQISADWYGKAPPGPIKWALIIDDQSIGFCGEVAGKATFDSALQCGECVEGLWEKDCIEFFLLNPSSGSYVEFNLGPQGAWWCCYLESYRKRATKQFRPVVKCESELLADKWYAAMVISREHFPIPFDANTLIEVTCISSGRFYSTNPPSGKEPDFHLRECFLPYRGSDR